MQHPKLDLFLTFAKVGATTFGGGYAMLPVLQREIVENKGWATEAELMDCFAVGQCTPGVIAVNTATFIGRKRAGVAGGVAATLGVVFPSFVLLSLLAGLITRLSALAWVKNAFAGMRVGVCVLIANAVWKLGKSAVIDRRTTAIFIVVAVGASVTSLPPALFVLLAGLCGVLLGKGGAAA